MKGVPAYPLRSNPGTPFLDQDKTHFVPGTPGTEPKGRSERAAGSKWQDKDNNRRGQTNEPARGQVGSRRWRRAADEGPGSERQDEEGNRVEDGGWRAMGSGQRASGRYAVVVIAGAKRSQGQIGGPGRDGSVERGGQRYARAVRRGVYGSTEGWVCGVHFHRRWVACLGDPLRGGSVAPAQRRHPSNPGARGAR
jgi:hypothetical protein